jgi:hypothetical protein
MKRHWLQISFALVFWAASAAAAEPRPIDSAGQVAAILGGMHVQRPAGDIALRIGDDLYVGDRLRTQAGDRAKIVLADDAVIDIGSNTELVIESRHTEAETGAGESVLILTAGRIRAIAPQAESGPRRFEVETPAAVAFRGGDFVISYDTAAQTSQVVALDGSISVAGKLGVVGGVVDVEPGFGTEVRKGRRPTTPQETDVADGQRLVQSTAMLGTGRQDGLEVLHPALNGRLMSSADMPRSRLAYGLRLGAPEEFLAEQLSADVRTNTQPLLEYKRRDPGIPSATGVEVDF